MSGTRAMGSGLPDPLRCTDREVLDLMGALAEHGEDSPEYRAALAVCTKKLADWIDDQAARAAYAQLAREHPPSADAVDPHGDSNTGTPSPREK